MLVQQIVSPSPNSLDYQIFDYRSIPEPITTNEHQSLNRIQQLFESHELRKSVDSEPEISKKRHVSSLNFGSIKN